MMYIRQQIDPTGISLGFGWLEDLAASSNETKAQMFKAQMQKLAITNTWRGVEREYRKWLEVRPGEDWEVYYLAAQAAGNLDCGTVRYLRLMKALGANPPPEKVQDITTEKQNMELGWAHVDIRLRRNAKGDLRPVGGLPFAGPGRDAILRAQKELKEKGKFHGLLPVLSYTIDGYKVPLGPESAISRVSVVNIDQKGDGSFQLKSKPGAWNYARASDECPLPRLESSQQTEPS
jgi:hypothetical protein